MAINHVNVLRKIISSCQRFTFNGAKLFFRLCVLTQFLFLMPHGLFEIEKIIQFAGGQYSFCFKNNMVSLVTL